LNKKTSSERHSLGNGQEKLLLFTDGSVNTKTKIGYGAYLFLNEEELSGISLKNKVKFKRFENTSSSKLELQTLLYALKEIKQKDQNL